MNPLHHIEGCAPRQYVTGPSKHMDVATRCYGGGSSSSDTSQPVTNQQVGLETGAGAGVAVGAGSTTGNINITSSDPATVAGALAAGTAALSTAGGVVTTAITNGASLAGQAITAQQETADHAEEVVNGIAASAITTGAQTAQSLGGAALNAGTVLGTAALQYGQNITTLNLNALNQNTALAFSTIAALDESQASGAQSAAAQDLTGALAAVAAGQGQQSASPIYIPVAGQQPYTGATATGGGIDSTTLLIVAGAAIALIFVMRKK